MPQTQQFQVIGRKADISDDQTFIVIADTPTHAKQQAEKRGYHVQAVEVYVEPNKRSIKRDRKYYTASFNSPFRRITFGQYMAIVLSVLLFTAVYLYMQGWRLSDYEQVLTLLTYAREEIAGWFE